MEAAELPGQSRLQDSKHGEGGLTTAILVSRGWIVPAHDPQMVNQQKGASERPTNAARPASATIRGIRWVT